MYLKITMIKKVSFAILILSLVILPSNAIFFKALKYLSNRGRNLESSSEDASYHINDGTSPLDDNKDHTGTFGFTYTGNGGIGDGSIDLIQFVSGPQYIMTSCFEGEGTGENCNNNKPISGDYVGYYENTKINKASCDETTTRNRGYAGFLSDKVTDGNGVVTRASTPLRVSCLKGENDAKRTLCKKWQAGSRLEVDSTDFCDLVHVKDIVENLLGQKSTAQTYVESKKLWDRNNEGTYNFDAMKTFSTGGTASSVNVDDLKEQQFTPEDFDKLDQQCYSLLGDERHEFDSVKCVAANHERVYGSSGQNTEITTVAESANAQYNLLQRLIGYGDGDGDANKCDVSDGQGKGCGLKAAIGSRYPDQEYCLSVKDRTMFTELFGCADDQRVTCGQDECVSGQTCECAGGIDEVVISSHADYLPEDWSDLKDKKYGSSNDNNYKCSEMEILVANELSSHLDRVDHDITLACAESIKLFEDASQKYVDFIDPSKITLQDDGDDKKYHNLYSVLREAWRQAEFMLRSMKIQEQVRDRMLKYRDWTIYRFDFIHATPNIVAVDDLIKAPNSFVSNDYTSITSQGGHDNFKAFLKQWNDIIVDYEKLSKHEIESLIADLDDVLREVNQAKEMAQELANTQQAASAAVATVSIHFRKKLNLWVQLEHLIEEAFKNALSTEDALEGQENRDDLNANYALTKSHDPKSFTYDIGNRAHIAKGEDYNEISNDVAARRSGTEGVDGAKSGHVFTSEYTASNEDAARTHEFKSSPGEIATALDCNAGNCMDDQFYLNGRNNCECNALVFEDADHPEVNRRAKCVDGHCVMEASAHIPSTDTATTTTVNITGTGADYNTGSSDGNPIVENSAEPYGGIVKNSTETEDASDVTETYTHAEKIQTNLVHSDSGNSTNNRNIDLSKP